MQGSEGVIDSMTMNLKNEFFSQEVIAHPRIRDVIIGGEIGRLSRECSHFVSFI